MSSERYHAELLRRERRDAASARAEADRLRTRLAEAERLMGELCLAREASIAGHTLCRNCNMGEGAHFGWCIVGAARRFLQGESKDG